MPPPTTDDRQAEPAGAVDLSDVRGADERRGKDKQDRRRHAVLEGRVESGVGHLLDGEAVQPDRQTADARGDHGQAEAPADGLRDRRHDPRRADPLLTHDVLLACS